MFPPSHWNVTCLWLMSELQWHPTAFLQAVWRKLTILESVIYIDMSSPLTSDLFHLIWQYPDSTGWYSIYCQISFPALRETSTYSDQQLCNKWTVRVVVYAHRNSLYNNRVVFFSFSPSQSHTKASSQLKKRAKPKDQPWLTHRVVLYPLVSSAPADVVVSLIITTGFITKKWYAVLAGTFELFMLLINNRHEQVKGPEVLWGVTVVTHTKVSGGWGTVCSTLFFFSALWIVFAGSYWHISILHISPLGR